jgi:lantibiotic modifying enzyme
MDTTGTDGSERPECSFSRGAEAVICALAETGATTRKQDCRSG